MLQINNEVLGGSAVNKTSEVRVKTNLILFFLSANRRPHGPQNGYTPLHQAAQQGHTHIINVLLQHGAKPNATTAVRRLAALPGSFFFLLSCPGVRLSETKCDTSSSNKLPACRKPQTSGKSFLEVCDFWGVLALRGRKSVGSLGSRGLHLGCWQGFAYSWLSDVSVYSPPPPRPSPHPSSLSS